MSQHSRPDGSRYCRRGLAEQAEESCASGFVTEGFLGSVRGSARAALDWLCGDRDDYAALQRRKATSPHRTRRRICRSLWIVSGSVMFVCAELSVIIALALGTTFLCFALLDEH